MLPLVGTTETPKNHDVVQFVPGFPDGDIPEHMTVRSQKLVCPGLQLPPLPARAPCPPTLTPVFAVREEVHRNVLQPSGRNGLHDIFSIVLEAVLRCTGPYNHQYLC